MHDKPISHRLERIFFSAFPHMLLMMLQSLIGAVDIFIVGGVGVSAIAAVGLCGFIFSVLMSCMTGIMIGVQSIVAKRIGQGRLDGAINAFHASVLLAVILGLILTLVNLLIPEIIYLVIKDHFLAKNCVEYLQSLVFAAPAFGVVSAFRGFFGGIGKGKFSLVVMIFVYLSNIVISYTLVKLGFGIRGAGLGTASSLYFGVLLFVLSGFLVEEKFSFYRIKSFISEIKTVVELSFYAGLQQFFFSAGFGAMFFIASQISSESLAIVTVLNNLMLLSVMPLLGLGLASATLVSESLGAKRNSDAKKWGNATLLVGLGLFFLQLSVLFISENAMFLFLKDEVLVNQHIDLFRLTTIFLFFETFAQILKFSLFGAGYNREIAKITIGLQWLLFIPVIYYLCVIQKQGISVLWVCFLAYRTTEALIIAKIWYAEKWFTQLPSYSQ